MRLSYAPKRFRIFALNKLQHTNVSVFVYRKDSTQEVLIHTECTDVLELVLEFLVTRKTNVDLQTLSLDLELHILLLAKTAPGTKLCAAVRTMDI